MHLIVFLNFKNEMKAEVKSELLLTSAFICSQF